MSSEIERLVATYPASTQSLIDAARKTLRAAFPNAEESVDVKARLLGYGYGPGYKGTVATLILSKSGVKIGIPYGARLADPAGLLAGSGKVHRHISITDAAQLNSDALHDLLQATRSAWDARSAR
jgi:hypothetical protein